jgi:tRNA pseudouridine55 synthase
MTQRSHTQQPRRNTTGILIVDKPTGWTSHDVVAKVRSTFRLKKIGHAGTLDPIATGVLVLLCGKATKAAESFLADEKEYRFVMRCGIETDTQDISGTVENEQPVHPLSDKETEDIISEYRGEIQQLPPMFSAVKVNGTRLYKLGRKGKVVEREMRTITIHSLDIESINWPDITLRALCSKGTYVRTLCHDIGKKMGCGACLAALVRLRSGSFCIENAHSLDTVLKWSPEQFDAACLPVPARQTDG